MKKLLTLALCILMVLTAVLVGCTPAATNDGNNDVTTNDDTSNTPAATVKFGAGVYTSTPSATDATEDKAGAGKIDATVAAVTVDADGKIAGCALDTASYTVNYTTDGKAVANESFMTKYELGDNYNMVTYGGAAKEWYAQADAFEALVVGKTLDEVKALVADANKGTDEVINAGCTIMIHEFVGAITEAYAVATTEISADATLKISIATEQTLTDATEEKNGSNKIAVNVFAAAVDAEGKVVTATSDCLEVSFTFDVTGASTFDATKTVLTKREQGDNYNMVTYGGATLEWYAQADAFDAACEGKTATEIAGFVAEDGHGVSDLQTAGCTIYVTGFVAAASKN